MFKQNSKTKTKEMNDFTSIRLAVASPDDILKWSRGEVTKAETINYRTQRSEKSGLFDEKIFGPERDFECYCGKYRGIRYKGIVCEKCGVELTRAIVRRERMGHIDLASPVSHIWFLRSMPSRISLVMGIPTADLERVIYFAGYIVTTVSEEERSRILKDLDAEYKTKVKQLTDEKEKEALKERLLSAKQDVEGIQPGRVLDEVEYHHYSVKYGTLFEAGIGAEAIYEIFKNLDLEALRDRLIEEMEHASAVDIPRISKRLSLVKSMIHGKLRPEWMFLTRIPVIPPALRPMVPLDGGRFATADANDLYRRVINRNNRLKKLLEIHAPDVILRNEKRILQEAVDALIDNTVRHNAASSMQATQAQRRALKSLADNLKGKRGLFRSNLLGKRVDYSGRSVIVVGPDLKLNQCGLPKHMALELFRPFVISELLKRELAFNIRGANRLIDDGIPEVWAILEEVTKDKYVLLNRAPTLHRLGIQAFKPILIEGSAIQVHPLVCTAFNADFDGDQMAVHVPLSVEAQVEAKEIMAADKNILKPGSGNPTVYAKMLDIVLGSFWMTKNVSGEIGEGKYFESTDAAIIAHDFGAVSLRAKIKVMPEENTKYAIFGGKPFETTIGRILFNNILPADYAYINDQIDRKKMAGIIDEMIERYGIESIPSILDKIKSFGFKYATQSGVTWGIDDVVIPAGKSEVIKEAKAEAEKIMDLFNSGLLSEDEKARRNIEIWHGAKSKVEKLIPDALNKNGSVYDMVTSGARGSMNQITQMAGMKGLIQATSGEIIEFPILSCSKEGLSPIEYFITTHGARKGLTDTALNTAKAGYLTRRLFDVAQDIVVREDDCGTSRGTRITTTSAAGMEIPLAKHIKGRFLAEDVSDKEGNALFKKGHLLSKRDADKIEQSGIKEVIVRSPMECQTVNGVCVKCYGVDLGNNKTINIGEAVGTVAAQAIGEPGTQLTMRTFHAGGTASVGGDITQGLPRVEEVFEKRLPKNPAVISHIDGTIIEIRNTPKDKAIVILPDGGEKDKQKVEYPVSPTRTILVRQNQEVKRGDMMTDGSADLDELFKYAGKEKTENYIIHEISKLYELQGESVSRKHIEVIIKQMFSRRKIKDSGDTKYSRGDVVDIRELEEENAKVKELGKEEAKAISVVMGITEVALSRKSFLSAASFQHTTRVLIGAAVRGVKDELVGLKENVILGRMIPAGTGYVGSPKYNLIKEKAIKPVETDRSEEA